MPGSDSVQRILVADDDDFICRFLNECLTRRGYTVKLVPNGTEAFETSGTGDYSLFILDLDMGQPTGLEVIDRLRAAGNETPIILMSGSFTSESLGNTPASVGVTYLTKPFSGAELDAAIESAIGKSAG